MKKLILLILILGYNILSAENIPCFVENKYSQTKHIHRIFSVNEAPSLFISHQYGTITLVSNENNNNQISIDIQIKISSNNESDVKERIKQISIDFSNSENSFVSAKTIIKNNSSFLKSFLRKSSVSMQINYTVSLPVKTKVSLENEYGDIFLNKIENDLKIDTSYGSINLGDIYANANINLEYSPNSSIKNIKNLNLNADYSKVAIESSDYIKTSSNYTNLKINDVKELYAEMDYGSLTNNSLEKGQIIGNYCGISLGKIIQQLTITSDYGAIRIGEITSSVNTLKINAEYASVSVNYNCDWNFSYSFSSSFAKIKTPEDLPFTKKNVSMLDTNIQGTKGNSKNIFHINCEYGDVKVECNK